MFRGPYKSAASTSLGTWVLMARQCGGGSYTRSSSGTRARCGGRRPAPVFTRRDERTLRARRGAMTAAGLEVRPRRETAPGAYVATEAGRTADHRSACERGDEEQRRKPMEVGRRIARVPAAVSGS
jgi:hypothetical protein